MCIKVGTNLTDSSELFVLPRSELENRDLALVFNIFGTKIIWYFWRLSLRIGQK